MNRIVSIPETSDSRSSYKNPEIEKKILNTFIQVTESRKYFSRLIPQVFSVSSFATLFSVIKDMYFKNEPLEDILLITNKLQSKLQSNQIVEVIDIIAPSKRNVYYQDLDAFVYGIQYLKELYFVRVSAKIDGKILESMVKRDIAQIVKLGNTFGKVYSSLFHIDGEVNFIQRAVELINSTEEYVPTAFNKLNEVIGGWTKGDVSSIGGKSGHNKTTFAVYDALHSVINGYCNRIAYFSIDEPGEMIARRIISNLLKVSLSDMRNKKVQLDASEVEKTVKSILKDKFIIIDDQFNGESIHQAILDIKPERVIIDHIQELDYGNEGISDQKIMVTARLLKESARLTHSNVTILSQVRDKVIDERFEDKIPRPHDFLYASDLRRKSREQCVVYWEYKDSQLDADFNTFELIVWKSTYSGTGRLKFNYIPDFASFTDKASTRNQLIVPQTPDDIWKNLDKITR